MKSTFITILFAFIYTTSIGQIKNDVLINLLTGPNWYSSDSIFVDNINIDSNNINIKFCKEAQSVLIDDTKIKVMTDSVLMWTNNKQLKVNFFANAKNLKTLIPQKWIVSKNDTSAVVNRFCQMPEKFNLANFNIALWNSHGRYYEKSLNRWEWQRARLFTSVEDILTASFVLPFLEPMLNNAGANVFMPRERDVQYHISIADNDDGNLNARYAKFISKTTGYKFSEKIYNNENPFKSGTAYTYSMTNKDTLSFVSQVDTDGIYSVYVSYNQSDKNSSKVMYIVHHADGVSQYIVNQKKGGSMWIYLGKHRFVSSCDWKVDVVGEGYISVDAIRLGGGMGRVVRGTETSGKAAWTEAARYYLQSDGFDFKTVYSLSNGANDYTDDVNCRGEWVNALINNKNIDIDAVIALHTDAGIARNDSTIGTLTIVTTKGNKYPNGKNKKISYDLAHAIENSIVHDIRSTWNPLWSERGIWDKGYSESRRAEAPSVLIELLSHQNLTDVRFAQHPQFRFDVCRAIYKAILRFFCGENATIQPLPISDFGLEYISTDSIRLSWQPTIDTLEPSAMPDYYIVYANNNPIATTSVGEYYAKQPNDGQLVDYHIVAVNKGGISFDSQHLAAKLLNDKAPLYLLVDGFDRVAAPDIVDTYQWAGILSDIEPGVEWGEDYFHCGAQYDFDTQNPWTDDDCPGWGASYANDEGSCTIGSRRRQCNKIAYDFNHEKCSFVSVSKEFFERQKINNTFDKVYIALGNQRTSWYGNMPCKHAIYNESFLNQISFLSQKNTELFITGAYIGSDITSDIAQKVVDVLGIKHRTAHASRTRIIIGNSKRIVLPQTPKIEGFAPSVDAIEPASKNAYTLYRYEDTGMSAAVKYGNITICGFSF